MSIRWSPSTLAGAALAATLVCGCNVHFDTKAYLADIESVEDSSTPPSDMGAGDADGGTLPTDSGPDLQVDAGPVTDASDMTLSDVRDAASADMPPDVAVDVGPDVADTGPDLGPDMADNPCSALQPVVYWPFDVLDMSTQTFQPSDPNLLTPAIPSDAAVTMVAGQSGMAPALDGVDDYIAIQHSDIFLLPQGSISLFVRRDVGALGGLFSKDASGTALGGHLTLEIVTGGGLEYRLQEQTGSHYLSSIQTIAEEQWVHVVVTFGPDGMVMYLNGVQQGTTNFTGGLYDPAAPDATRNEEPIGLGIATNGSGTGSLFPLEDHLAGAIDELAFFDTQLTLAEVQALRDPACDLAP